MPSTQEKFVNSFMKQKFKCYFSLTLLLSMGQMSGNHNYSSTKMCPKKTFDNILGNSARTICRSENLWYGTINRLPLLVPPFRNFIYLIGSRSSAVVTESWLLEWLSISKIINLPPVSKILRLFYDIHQNNVT